MSEDARGAASNGQFIPEGAEVEEGETKPESAWNRITYGLTGGRDRMFLPVPLIVEREADMPRAEHSES
jgi:hypothetical protein